MSVEIRQINPFTHRDAVFRVYCDSRGLDTWAGEAGEKLVLGKDALR